MKGLCKGLAGMEKLSATDISCTAAGPFVATLSQTSPFYHGMLRGPKFLLKISRHDLRAAFRAVLGFRENFAPVVAHHRRGAS